VELTGIPLYQFPWVRTFIPPALRSSRNIARFLGYQPPLQIYASYQQQKLIKDIAVGEMNIEKSFCTRHLQRKSPMPKTRISGDLFYAQARVARKRMIDIFHRYEQELKSKNAVDFDNILFLTRNLLRDHESIRAYYQNLFDFILCDEYQDTNNIQEELTGLLMRNGKLFCVGDDWQAILFLSGQQCGSFSVFPG